MKKIVFIPVRGGSKSIRLKNIKEFCGKPLVYWTAKAAQDSSSVEEVVIATDDFRIKEICLGFNFSKLKVYERSAENAQDISSTESIMLEYITNSRLDSQDRFILLQATSPFLKGEDISKANEQFEKSSVDSLLSCAQIKRFFWKKNGKTINYDYMNRPRRQDFEGTLVENGAIYINTVKNIKSNKNRLGGQIGIYVMPEYTMTEMDEPDDWVYAGYLMRKYILSKRKKTIKLFLTDVDGVLTDLGMYYSENGDELKKFNTHDGMAFQLLREAGVKTGIITSENTKIVEKRANKLKVDFLCQGIKNEGKLIAAKRICEKLGISLEDVAYIGDDINCFELLDNVGISACPCNALDSIKAVPRILILNKNGGEGAVREFVEYLLRY